MTSQDKALQGLLELGNPADRRTRGELFDRALRTALMLTDADAVILTTPNRRGERLVLHAGSTMPAALQVPPDGSEVIRRLTERCQPLVFPNLADEPRIAAGDCCPGVEAGPVLFTPVRRRDLVPAYVAAYRRRGRVPFSMNDDRLMLLLAAWLSAVLENLRLSTGTARLAVMDDVTDVYNYRYLKTALRREVRRASRYGQELSVVMIDVDNLKTRSEEFGDLKGSLLLKELASALAQQVRTFDVMAKYGEDEFVLVLPQTNGDGAVEVAERMRAAVEQHAFSLAPAGTITVSLGVASFPQDATEISDLVAAADRALQQAKQRGKNCVATLTSHAAMTDLGSLIAPRAIKRPA